MTKNDINPMPEFFDRYIHQVDEENIFEAFDASLRAIDSLDLKHLHAIGDQAYAPDKWTVKDVFQHIIDNERVQSYRAMRIARADTTELPGYDQDLLAAHANTSRRSMDDMIEELKIVRRSSIMFFKSLDESAMFQTGICSGKVISALGLAFMCVGHQIHHFKVLNERYWNLA